MGDSAAAHARGREGRAGARRRPGDHRHAQTPRQGSPNSSTACACTDRETADIVQMVLAGKVNKSLVGYIQSMRRQGHRPVRHGRPHDRGPQAAGRRALGYVGEIVNVNTQPILDVLEKGYIPVISTVGCDERGQRLQHQRRHRRRPHRREPGRGEPHLHDRHPRHPARPRTTKAPSFPPSSVSEAPAAHPRGHHLRRHDPQDRMLHRGHPPGRKKGVHHRRPRPARHSDRDA